MSSFTESSVAFMSSPKVRLVSVCAQGDPVRHNYPTQECVRLYKANIVLSTDSLFPWGKLQLGEDANTMAGLFAHWNQAKLSGYFQ